MQKPVAVLLGVLGLLALGAIGVLVYLLQHELGLPVPPNVDAGLASPLPVAALEYTPEPIGRPVEGHPVITHVCIADLDSDGLADILVCDATANQVTWLRQSPRGVFTEAPVGESIPAPAHVSVCDLNQDGKPDLLVASMGMVLPNNDRIGQVIVLENLGENRFQKHVVAENIARVTDVRGADLNGDGRLDLVVGQFGYDEGEVRWMENLGDWQFRSHIVSQQPGTITTPPADYDRDGKMDFAALISQDAEEVHLFQNLGNDEFRDRVLWKAQDESWGGSGLEVCDLNHDGLPDLVCSNGDGFNVGFTEPSPWHGLQWLENHGGGKFEYHRIGDMPGCYGPVCVDLNGDGALDIVAVSAFNHVVDPSAVWMTAWLNDGHQKFTPVPLARGAPTRLITVAAGDLDGNGVPVLVTGAFHAYPPYSHMSRLTLWRRR